MAVTHASTEAAKGAGDRKPGGLLENTRGVALTLAAILLAGVAIRGYRLSDKPFFFDEAFSSRLIEFPLVEMLRRAAHDVHPPLYYLLLKSWAAVVGTSPFALRSLSVLLGGVTVLGMYLFAVQAFGDRRSQEARADGRGAGLLLAALVAVSVFQIRWAWEARMYTLGTALAAFSSWALLRAVRTSPPSRGPWVLYGILAVLFAYTHYYALFSIAAQAVFVLGYLLVRVRGDVVAAVRSGLFRHALLGGAIVVAGWLPWVPVFTAQRRQVQADYWTPAVTGWDVPRVCYEMFVEPENALVSHPEALAAAALCGWGLLALLWRARAGEWYVVCAAVVPFGLSVLVSVWDTKVFSQRYFLFAHLFFLAALARLLWRVPGGLPRGLLTAAVLGGGLWAYVSFWERMDIANRPGAKGAVEYLAGERKAGEPVVACSPLFYLPTRYHAGDRSGWRVYDDGKGPVHYMGGPVLTADDLITDEQLRAITAGRVWVIGANGNWARREVEFPPHWLLKRERRFPEVHVWQGQVTVAEYEVVPSAAGP
jgi:mannosyltransferase